MPDPDLDKELREYLREQRSSNGRQHAEVVAAVRDVSNQVIHLTSRVDKIEERSNERHEELLIKFGAHSSRIDALEEAEEVTDVHERERLLTKIQKHEEKAKDWRRLAFQILGGVLIAAGVAAGSSAVTTWITKTVSGR